MNNNDHLQRFIFDQAPIRGEIIHLEDSFKAIIEQHDYPKPIRKLLGEALCVAGLLSAIIKFNGRLTVQFRGKGRLKLLLAQCDNQFNMRGLAKWDGNLSYDDLMESFKDGVLVIMLDSGLKSQYQGIVSWRGNSLVESIEGYFKDSEQLATKIWLSVNETEAAGFLLQVIPNDEKPNDEPSEETWKRIIQLTERNFPADILEVDHESLLNKLYPQDDIRLFPSVFINFKCTCNRKRGEDAIMLLGKQEAEEELNNKQTIIVTCDFCNEEYVYDRSDVANIFKHEDRPPETLH